MDKNTMESLGISYLEATLARTGQILPDIKVGDKGVSWDGDIAFYKTQEFKKENLYSIIPTQVKCHSVKTFNNKQQVYKSDLINFKIKKFVIFFVVEILEDNLDAFKIYYKSMLLYDMEKAISEFDEIQESKVFDFDAFPDEKQDIISLFRRFSDDHQRLNHTIGTIKSVGEFINQKGGDKPFSFDVSLLPGRRSFLDICKAVEEQKPYIYYQDKFTETCFTVDKFENVRLAIKTDRDLTIRLDNKVYFRKVIVESTSSSHTVTLGKSIRVTFNNKVANISFHLDGDIEERINAISFMLGITKGQKIFVNNSEISFCHLKSDTKVEKLEELLKLYEKIKKVLEYLHVDNKDYDLSMWDDKNVSLLIDIYDCAFLNKRLSLLDPHFGPAFVRVFGLNILCMVSSDNETSCIYDFFDDRNRISFKDSEGNILSENSPMYLILCDLKNNPFNIIDNIDFGKMISTIFSNELSREELGRANGVFLNLLKYYDSNGDKEVLRHATTFAKKLDDVDPSDISKINLLQCYVRKRKLNKKERESLLKIISSTKDGFIQLGCYSILGNSKEVKELFESLSDNQKKEIQLFPIYNLLRKLLS